MADVQSGVNAGASSNQLAGAAKYGAVGILGFLAGAGTLWSVTTREPAPIAAAQQPAPIQQAPIIVQPPQVVIHMPPQSPAASPATNPGESGVMGPMPSAPNSSEAPAEVAVPVVITPPTAPPSEPTTAPSDAAPSRTAKLNINAATAAQFELLPGIGPSLASRIVAYRTAHGRFGSITELDKVEGIGPKTLERLAPLISVE